ncbi:Hypothetical_protein [Hexamita inflata]|uniref:Hypothetical_protein n=1 Tax=Hexamita inflata TaxID=28002 RepID=A0AA86U1A3_9EUKA|nr:Hypothetical protein HINF_LOCUS25800 [Hexamita inflata]
MGASEWLTRYIIRKQKLNTKLEHCKANFIGLTDMHVYVGTQNVNTMYVKLITRQRETLLGYTFTSNDCVKQRTNSSSIMQPLFVNQTDWQLKLSGPKAISIKIADNIIPAMSNEEITFVSIITFGILHDLFKLQYARYTTLLFQRFADKVCITGPINNESEIKQIIITLLTFLGYIGQKQTTQSVIKLMRSKYVFNTNYTKYCTKQDTSVIFIGK